jgi:hypothetical protein
MHDLSLHILELIENSINARATVVAIAIEIDRGRDLLVVRVEDDGVGIRVSPEQALNPFYTTSRKKRVGLGLSFFKAAAELAGGKLTVSNTSRLGGAAVEARMLLTHVNRPPLGDLATTVSTMVLVHPSIDFRLDIRSGGSARSFQVSEFARRTGLDGGANVQLASSVMEALRAELEPWTRTELITWAEKMGVRSQESGVRRKTLAGIGAAVFTAAERM